MSAGGRRRPEAGDPSGDASDGRDRRPPVAAVRLTATLSLATLVAAAVVPVALLPDPPAAPRSPGQDEAPAAGALRAAAPTDLIRSRQWYLNSLRVPKAWRWGKGRDVTVAVLDTGVDGRHKDLTGQVVAGPDYTDRTRRQGGKYWGGHGTAMAGIIAGHGNGPGQAAGIVGVAPQAKVLSIRVTWENDDPLRQSGSLAGRNRDAVARGIRYAVDNGADIINMSLGGGRAFYNGNSTEEEAIRYALSKGVVLIASAGNDGAGANRKNFPAAYPGVIAVGALDQRMRVWKDTNRNSYVSVCAPGVNIISAAPGNRYVLGTGTSPSSAIVAGVAALIRSRYPRLTPEEVRQALIRGSRRRTGAGAGTGACSRSLDAVQAVYAAHQINKRAHGGQTDAAPKATTPPPAPAAEPPAEDSNLVLWGILGGGGLLVVVGLVLGWRQRRRSEEDGAEPPFPQTPREPVSSMAGPVADRHGAEDVDPRWSPSEPGTGVQGPPADAEPPWSQTSPPMYAAPAEPDPVAPSAAWTPSPDLHLPPLEATGNGFSGGNGHGNGNGHRPLDPGSLQPFDPSAVDAEPETLSFPAPLAPDPFGPRPGGTPAPGPPSPGEGADPLGGGRYEDDPLGTGFPDAEAFGAGPLDHDPLGAGPLDNDPLGTGPVPSVGDTPLAQESWRSVHEARADDPSARTSDLPVPPDADPAAARFEESWSDPEDVPPADPGSATAPFTALGDQQLSWRRPEADDSAAGPLAASDELATTSFPAVGPQDDDPDGPEDSGSGSWSTPADDDEHRPPWW